MVTFSTNLGYFTDSGVTAAVATQGGVGRVRVASQQKGVATITAVVMGGGLQRADVNFTDDPAETFEGNSFVSVQSTGALLYSAGDRLIVATEKARDADRKGPPGAHLSYRNIEIWAQQIQVDCTSTTARAVGDVTYRRGGSRLLCGKLFVSLPTGDGYALATVERRIRPMKVRGNGVKLEPLQGVIPPKLLEISDLSEAQLVISSSHVLLFPGEKLQFKRPRFYQDGQAIMALSYYSLSLFSTQLFTDQFLSVGTQGFGVDVPFYYDMTPGSTGVIRVRYGEQAGRTMYARRPGLALDLTQSYRSMGGGGRYSGEMGLTGINRSDWGVRWTHSQEFSQVTRASFFVDFPQHRSLYGSTNLSHRIGPLQVGVNVSANRSLVGPGWSGTQGDLYVEATPRKVGRTGYMMALGGSVNAARTVAGEMKVSSFTQSLLARFFSRPFRLDGRTTVSNNVSLGHMWTSTGRAGLAAMSSVTALRNFGRGATMEMSYDFTHKPVNYMNTGSHRISVAFRANGRKWNANLYNAITLDAPVASVIGDFGFVLAPRWRMWLGATLQQFSLATYRDFELGVARSVGGRDVSVSYSTLSHRFFLDLQASRF